MNNWEYFNNFTELKVYITKNELIELSKVCKNFRKRIKGEIFDKLELFKSDKLIYNRRACGNSRKSELDNLIIDLRADLVNVRHLFKKVTLYNNFIYKFSRNLLENFPNITSIRIEFNNGERFLNLYSCLRYSKKLTNLKLNCDKFYNINFEKFKKDPEYFKSVRYLKLLESSYNSKFFSKISSNEIFFNYLTKIFILNEDLLDAINKNLPALKDIEFSINNNFTTSIVITFLNKNPQLTRLSISKSMINQSVLNCIMSLDHLNYLRLDNCNGELDQVSNLPLNRSISHINFKGIIPNQLTLELIKSCITLSILEIRSAYTGSVQSVQWSSITKSINTLHLNGIKSYSYSFDTLLSLDCFKKIKFTNMHDVNYYKKYHRLDVLEHWKLVTYSDFNIEEFELIKN